MLPQRIVKSLYAVGVMRWEGEVLRETVKGDEVRMVRVRGDADTH